MSKYVAIGGGGAGEASGVLGGLFVVTDPEFGAVGDGIADDTAALQAAINAAQDAHGTVYLPRGTYKTTAALEVADACQILGEACLPLNGSVGDDFNTINLPVVAPYLAGTVVVPSTAGQNGITITGAGRCVNLADFGILFADPIRFADTGHGIHYMPPLVPTKVYRDNGLINGRWDNVTVMGHDGDHYAFYLTNPIYCTLTHLRSYGGGVMFIENDGLDSGPGAQYYGNCQIDHLYGQLFIGGTADGIRLKNTRARLNLLLFNRPQVSAVDYTASFPGYPPADPGAQKMLNVDDLIKTLTIIAPDFETNVGCGVRYPQVFDSMFVSPGGIVGTQQATAMKYEGQSAEMSQGLIMQQRPGTGDQTLQNIIGVGTDLKIGTDANRVLHAPGAVQSKAYTTAGRPAAATVGAGAQVFDTTLNRPVWSNGTAWVDAAGTNV